MKNKPLSAFTFFLLALALLPFSQVSTAQSQEIEISLDRNEVPRGETVILTIRVNEQRQSMQIDLEPLTDQFDILGTNTSTQIRSINGAVEAWTDYIVTLFPLEEGNLVIPELDINGTKTPAMEVTVSNTAPRSNQSDEEVYLEIETNKDSVYVQEQLLLNIKLFYTINGIRNPVFTALELEDAVTQAIDPPNQYEQVIDGVRYGVYEKRLIIFPQRSGPLEIPDILFRGEITNSSRRYRYGSPNIRRITAFIEGITIDVMERPSTVMNDEFWLPTSKLTLEERWSADPNSLQPGDSVVRTLTMSAEGLDGAVLPPFSPTEIEGFKLYPNPAEIERNFVDGAILGTRVESTTLVAVDSGSLIIPEISIPWWNITSDQLEATVLPASRLEISAISGETPSEQAIASTEELEEPSFEQPALNQDTGSDTSNTQTETEFIKIKAAWFNYAIAAALIIVLFSIYRLVIAANKTRINNYLHGLKTQRTNNSRPSNNERTAYKQLVRACNRNDLAAIRNSLIIWCDHHITTRSVASMEDILQQNEAPALQEHAAVIQSILFQSNDNQKNESSFNAKDLLQLIAQLRKEKLSAQKKQQQEEQYSLPPLYKA